MKKLLALILVVFPFQLANSSVEPQSTSSATDDSAAIVERIRQAIPNGGLISVEQRTGRLLFNPTLERLFTKAVKQKFLMPGIVVNQNKGLQLVNELPFSCFLMNGGELAGDDYAEYRQHATLLYIRDVKQFPVSRVLICETIGKGAKSWASMLDLMEESDPFVFDEQVNRQGEHFFYYLNTDGSFEMYM